ncbi:ACC deaminase [Fusarium pseudocircinatum]|uniref:ACC deaminase n=1 Tax=Fusarium pseudocircinatum TaxID=56676 RepID=A0A8H5KMN1_9HYPO|nr:ACC deaminase [Fusarium pseudocircinatum]
MHDVLDTAAVRERIDQLPRAPVGFYPTPFHQLHNMPKKLGINLYMKREDLAGPSAISGSKVRLSEFILGQAVKDGYTHIITHGAHLTNSGLQFAAAAAVSGLTPMLYLTRDLTHHGKLDEYRGNLLLSKIMDVETQFINSKGRGQWMVNEGNKIITSSTEGHRAIIVRAGGAHPLAFVAHALTFVEMLEQSKNAGVELDYIYHTAGTGTALPGMLAGKLLTRSPVKIRSITINAYGDKAGDVSFIGIQTIVDRVKGIFERLEVLPPSDDVIRAEINFDQGFIGEDYGVPSTESISAIQELARAEGIFLGPVYTGKGFAGLLHHVRSGKVPVGSNVAFLHTGDAANLFESSAVVGEIVDGIKSDWLPGWYLEGADPPDFI